VACMSRGETYTGFSVETYVKEIAQEIMLVGG
jgi:hypothetical protein